MVIAGAVIWLLAVSCFWLSYRSDVWKTKYNTASDQRDVLQKEYDFLKESVASWNTKPVYALLSDQQIAQIGEMVGKYMKEPKWLN